MEPRKTFVMSIEFWAGAKVLDAPQKAVLLQAIMAFNGADCEMPEMDQATAGVFGMMEPFFNASRAHYDDVCNKRRELAERADSQGKQKKQKQAKPTIMILIMNMIMILIMIINTPPLPPRGKSVCLKHLLPRLLPRKKKTLRPGKNPKPKNRHKT